MKVKPNELTDAIAYPEEVKIVITPELLKSAAYYTAPWDCPLCAFFNRFFENKVKTYSFTDVAMIRAKGSKEVEGQMHELVQYELQDIFAEHQYYQVKRGGTFTTTAKLVPVTRTTYVK